MYPRSHSPPVATAPAVSNFKTPKAANIKNRSNITGDGPSNTSAEMQLAGKQGAPKPEAFGLVNSRLSSELARDGVLYDNSSRGVAPAMDNSMRVTYGSGSGASYQQNYDTCSNVSGGSYSEDRWCQNNVQSRSQDAAGLRCREIAETGTTSNRFSDSYGLPRYHHVMLTDADKLQQYNNQAGYTMDSCVQRGSGPSHANWIPNAQQGTGVFMNSQLGRHSYGSSEESFYNGSPHDVAAWLQHHKQELRQQQLEDNHSNSLQGRSGSLAHHSSTGDLSDSRRIDILKEAADDIIKAKDNIIERQKAKIRQLESTLPSGNGRSLTGDYRQLNEDILEKKLGATEYELREVRKSLESKLSTKEETINNLNEKLKEKNEIVGNWEKKCTGLKSEVDTLQQRVSNQDRYLSNLPTTEEHSKNLHIIRTLKDDMLRQEEKAAQLEKRLKEMVTGLQSRDSFIQVLENNNKDQLSKIQELEASNKELLEKLSAKVDLQHLENLKQDNRRLCVELEKAKKVLDSLNKQLQHQTSKQKIEVMQHKEQLEHEAKTVTSLQQQIVDKEQVVKNLQQAIKKTTAENQNLTEKNTKLEDELKEMKKVHSLEEQKLQQQLMKELNISFCDLQSLVKVCLQRADGQDPNLTALLGVRDFAVTDAADSVARLSTSVAVNSLNYQLSKARDLRLEIDRLREIISDKFAEDMGRRLTCNPQ